VSPRVTCGNCYKRLKSGSKFCTRCGRRVTAGAAKWARLVPGKALGAYSDTMAVTVKSAGTGIVNWPELLCDPNPEGPPAVSRRWADGTLLGPLFGSEGTGKHGRWPEVRIFRVADGRITEHWDVIDQLSMRGQLGLLLGHA